MLSTDVIGSKPCSYNERRTKSFLGSNISPLMTRREAAACVTKTMFGGVSLSDQSKIVLRIRLVCAAQPTIMACDWSIGKIVPSIDNNWIFLLFI
jgi:hypothetical protein